MFLSRFQKVLDNFTTEDAKWFGFQMPFDYQTALNTKLPIHLKLNKWGPMKISSFQLVGTIALAYYLKACHFVHNGCHFGWFNYVWDLT